MDCEHSERFSHSEKPLLAALALTGSFFFVELVGGLWTGSLALLADALHMAVDLVALGASLFAARVSRLPPDAKRTFGYQRVEVLAALGNGMWLLLATGIILREAYFRFVSPSPVMAPQMLAIAAVGLVCNLASGAILYSSGKSNINLRGAFIHVAADACGSVGAIAAGLIIFKTGWYRADPLASVLICAGIVFASVWIMRDSIHILLEGTPPHLNLEEIRSALAGLEGVREVHDLHLWSLTKGSESLSGHLVLEPGRGSAEVLKAGQDLLKDKFGLSHVTLQIES